MNQSLEGLIAAQRGLRARFDDFRRALDRRDEEAYRLAMTDLSARLRRWTEAEEKTFLPALLRASVPGREAAQELRVECVQVRELARYLLFQINERASIADILGLADNLDRRLAAHESELERVYYPACAPLLTAEEWKALEEAVPPA